MYRKIEELRKKLAEMRPLCEGELKRLREEFIVGNTFHSNAIEGSTLTLRETALILGEGVTIAEKPSASILTLSVTGTLSSMFPTCRKKSPP